MGSAGLLLGGFLSQFWGWDYSGSSDCSKGDMSGHFERQAS